jgi:hypothetical protein
MNGSRRYGASGKAEKVGGTEVTEVCKVQHSTFK